MRYGFDLFTRQMRFVCLVAAKIMTLKQTLGVCVAASLSDVRRDDMETATGGAAMNAVVPVGTGVGHIFTHA